MSECTIVISEHEIDAPAPKPDVTAVLDIRAAKAWTDKVRPGGLLMRNCSLITDEVCRDDIDVFEIPISDIATEVGNLMCSSMVAVGALASLTGAFRIEDCLEALSDVVPTHRKSLMELNRQALIRGASFVGANRTGVSAHGTV